MSGSKSSDDCLRTDEFEGLLEPENSFSFSNNKLDNTHVLSSESTVLFEVPGGKVVGNFHDLYLETGLWPDMDPKQVDMISKKYDIEFCETNKSTLYKPATIAFDTISEIVGTQCVAPTDSLRD